MTDTVALAPIFALISSPTFYFERQNHQPRPVLLFFVYKLANLQLLLEEVNFAIGIGDRRSNLLELVNIFDVRHTNNQVRVQLDDFLQALVSHRFYIFQFPLKFGFSLDISSTPTNGTSSAITFPVRNRVRTTTR